MEYLLSPNAYDIQPGDFTFAVQRAYIVQVEQVQCYHNSSAHNVQILYTEYLLKLPQFHLLVTMQSKFYVIRIELTLTERYGNKSTRQFAFFSLSIARSFNSSIFFDTLSVDMTPSASPTSARALLLGYKLNF